jgi:hypothetical protein
MTKTRRCPSGLIRKIRNLTPEELAAVEAFVDSLGRREGRQLTAAAVVLGAEAFREVWDNPADAAYDRL